MRKFIITALFGLAGALGGCEETPPRMPETLVPFAAITQRPSRPMVTLASAILPASDSDYEFPRAEKGVDGTYSLGDVSSYTLYRMDAQRIDDSPWGIGGYQYRWVVQQGFSVPPPP